MEIESFVSVKTSSKYAERLRRRIEENLLSFDFLYEIEEYGQVRFFSGKMRQLAIYDLIDEISDLSIECKIHISGCNDPKIKNKIVYFKRGVNDEMKKISTEC